MLNMNLRFNYVLNLVELKEYANSPISVVRLRN